MALPSSRPSPSARALYSEKTALMPLLLIVAWARTASPEKLAPNRMTIMVIGPTSTL